MKSFINLREAFVVFLALSAIACLNAGQIQQHHNTAVKLMNWELTQLLALNKNQMEKIHAINAVYEVALSKLHSHNSELKQQEINRLLCERNKRILEVLNHEQQNILYHYCTDVVSFSKME